MADEKKMDVKKSIFRKESLDRISSPEEYDQYLKVTGPGVWMLLCVIVLLLVGALCWAVFGRLSTKMNVAVIAEDGQVVCAVPSEELEAVLKSDMKVTIAGQTYSLVDTGRAPELLTEDTDLSVLIAGELRMGSFINYLSVNAALADGVYSGQIEVEAVSPIYFILN